MPDRSSGVVDIVRAFLLVHRSLGALLERCREGAPCFEALERLVGDDGSSALYRLKEQCHATFRPSSEDGGLEVHTDVLLDLAVGSLFHEAMKLRENLYQQERYGPRVKALKARSDPATVELLGEFEKILDSSALRLSEAVEEVDFLLAQTRQQILRLLTENFDDGLLLRCVYEERELFSLVVPDGPEGFFTDVFGDPALGFMKVADSYLESAYFEEALEVFGKALAMSPESVELRRGIEFAQGMEAFLSRKYPTCVDRLSAWVEDFDREDPAQRGELALAAIRHIEKVQSDEDTAPAADAVQRLHSRLKELAGT